MECDPFAYFLIICAVNVADIKNFMSDVKPALLSALDVEFEKNPYEVVPFIAKPVFSVSVIYSLKFSVKGPAAPPKKMVKASDSILLASSGTDGLPREDISGKITPNLIKNLGSADWKVNII